MSCAGGRNASGWLPPASAGARVSRWWWRYSDLSGARELRQGILARRRALGAEANARLSARAVKRFLEFWESRLPAALAFQGLKVGLYHSLPDELSLLTLEERLVAFQARSFFPRIVDRGTRELEFVEIAPDRMRDEGMAEGEKERAWIPGPYGIHEPHPRLPAAAAASLDVIVVPGVAFGPSGERIGMGMGYYDRFLARVPGTLRIVVAFDFQLLDSLEQQPWDQPVDWIITDQREMRGARVDPWLDRLLNDRQPDRENP